jgi:F0F1-type ATP synthase membrane subunit b/b'
MSTKKVATYEKTKSVNNNVAHMSSTLTDGEYDQSSDIDIIYSTDLAPNEECDDVNSEEGSSTGHMWQKNNDDTIDDPEYDSESSEELELYTNQIIYENIDEDGKYCRGKYGDIDVIIHRETGYFNANKICSDCKTKNGRSKEFRKWVESNDSKELILEASSDAGIPASEIMMTIRSSSKNLTIIRGTYVHPILVPHIASWASKKFAIQVSNIVNDYMVKKYIDSIKKKNDRIDKLCGELKKSRGESKKAREESKKAREESKKAREESKKAREESKKLRKKLDVSNMEHEKTRLELKKTRQQMKKIQKSNLEYIDKHNIVMDEIKKVSSDRVLPTGRKKDEHILVILRTNYRKEDMDYDSNDKIGSYYVMRIMNKSLSSRMTELHNIHPFCEIITIIRCSPNSMNLWHHAQDQLSKTMIFKKSVNYFNIQKGYKMKDIINLIKETFEERIIDDDYFD